MTIYTIPRANAPIAGSQAPTIQWYNYLNYLASQTSPSDLQAQIDALSAEIAKIPGGFNLKTIDSIAMTGNSGVGGLVQLSLVGDVNAPSSLSFYGSVPSNDAGWYTFSSNFADNAGSLDLSQPAIGSGGTLALLGFDAYGRLSETAAASTTNLPEGTNLYFTVQRAQDAAGALAVGTGNVPLTYSSSAHTLTAALSNTGVTAGTYGDSTHYAIVTVDINGRVTAASQASIMAGSGTVTSVGLTAPSIFTVSGSPVTASGTLALALTTQNAGLVFAGPVSGSAAIPNFRSIAVTDINFGSNLLTDQAGNQLTDQSGNDLIDNGLGVLPVSVLGNAATATALQTPVMINGISFNGTSNITIPVSSKLAQVPFTSTGSLIVPATTNSIKIRLWGQGGSGGSGTGTNGAGGGGGGGGYTEGVYPVTPGSTVAITIGPTCSVTGMISGTCSATAGTNGSPSAGTGAAGGTGGVGLGGSFNVNGNPGGPSYAISTTIIGGSGGPTFSSYGAAIAIGSQGGLGTFPGGGGGGGSGINLGGTGGGALCLIEFVQ